MLTVLLTVNAAALRPSLNKSFQPPLLYLSRLLAKDDYATARVKGGRYIYIYMYTYIYISHAKINEEMTDPTPNPNP